ncbi:GNAT family N-acetyltransferase [Nonomuraea antimicrobica]
MHLEQLAVDPAHMRQGIGGRLVTAVVDHARAAGASAVTLTTFRDVPWNAPWYERHGFATLPETEWGPELRALVEHERELGIEVAPRVAMRRRWGGPAGDARA